MRLVLLMALCATTLTACGPDMMGSNGGDDTAAPETETYQIWAERLDEHAQVNAELLATWDDPNAHGWHFQQPDTEGDVELEFDDAQIEGALASNPDFALENLHCIRFNVTWGEGCEQDGSQSHCNWLSYGQGDSAYTTGDYSFDAPGDWETPWIVDVDSGSSLISCRN